MKETLHIYTRVSSSIQEEGTSLKTQREIGIELSNKLGMKYQVHNEGGISSSKDTLENRPVMLNLLRLMEEGKIKNLYVWNTDRLSRNQITWFSIRRTMVKNCVVLYTSNGIHNTQDYMENMILGILSEVSQYDNKVRTERSRLGKIEKVKLNYWRGGDCPFGYKLCSDGNGNKLVVNEDESKWVLFIFNEYSQGTTLKEIKLQLERNGVKTRRGNLYWSLGSLQVILRNEIYIGVDVFVDKKTNLKITNTIPQIISNKLWGIVQEKRKLKLLRKGQFNRTTNFYLFRDFMICSCGTPIGGRIKIDKSVRHYYCPLSERKFNKSVDDGKMCSMKRCMNIPTTDKILWEKVIDVLGNTIELKDWLKDKTTIGSSMKSYKMDRVIKEKELKITELIKRLNDLEKGLVKVETENVLNNYPSVEIYKSLKKDLTKRYNNTKIEIEDLRNSLQKLGNEELWYEWLERFGKEVRDKRDISDTLKKELLQVVLKDIIVEYDHTQKVHILTINFNIPVLLRDEVRPKGGRQVIITPPKSGRKSLKPNSTLPYYSTVIKGSTNILQGKGYSLRLSVQLVSPNLWVPPYTNYQQELFDIITKFHEVDGWNFKMISDWLVKNNYLTPRGTIFNQPKCWSIYKKKKRSVSRFTRSFNHTITGMSIDVVDYTPTTTN
jgi:DNA invertase Pin-like site-specific DNA recombinase